MLYENITRNMTKQKFVKEVGRGAAAPAGGGGGVRLSLSSGEGGDLGIQGWLVMKHQEAGVQGGVDSSGGGGGSSTGGEEAAEPRWSKRWCALLAAERRINYFAAEPSGSSAEANTPQGYIALDNATVQETKDAIEGEFAMRIGTSATFDQEHKAREFWLRAEDGQPLPPWLASMEKLALGSLPFRVERVAQ